MKTFLGLLISAGVLFSSANCFAEVCQSDTFGRYWKHEIQEPAVGPARLEVFYICQLYNLPPVPSPMAVLSTVIEMDGPYFDVYYRSILEAAKNPDAFEIGGDNGYMFFKTRKRIDRTPILPDPTSMTLEEK